MTPRALLGLTLTSEELEQAGDVVIPPMVERLVVLLRGRVVVPLDLWATWHPIEQEALARAGDRVRALEAVDGAMASQGPAAAARVLARVDGGQALVRLELEALASEVAGAAAADVGGEDERELAAEALLGVGRGRRA